jgi:TPR repeat protein
MKRVRTSVAAVSATTLLAISGAEAALHRAVSISETDPSGAWASAPDAPTTTTPLNVIVGAAEAGNVEAMNVLGVLYTVGMEVPRDYSKALHWYQKAIDGGSTNAMNNAAKLYLHGIGVPRDYANAAALFKRSAMLGSVQGMYSFAVMADKRNGHLPRRPACA